MTELRARPRAGSTVLVTGATDGLGRAVATELARTGASVLLHGRDEARGEQTLAAIRAERPATTVSTGIAPTWPPSTRCASLPAA